MKYLPILQELFESDSVIFLLVGLVAALAAGIRLRSRKRTVIGAAISLGVYAVCELGTYLVRNYLSDIILLFLGTLALGCMIGFLAAALVGCLRKKAV